jgi:cathepsin L
MSEPTDPTMSDYAAYTSQYDKHYSADEFMEHYGYYRDNVRYINAKNANASLTYRLGVNRFTDISRDAFAQTYLSNKYTPHNLPLRSGGFYPQGIPPAIDWRASGWVTNVKDQQQCGSCWAFSAVGAIEGQHANATRQLVSLSEQNLVDCSYGYGCEGCDGGWPEAAMRYVAGNGGLDTEVSYPYTAEDGSCAYNKTQVGGYVSKTHNVTSGDMSALYSAIAKIGPISVAIDAESDFQFYASGVFSSTDCSSQMLDHAVLAVGYGVSAGKQKYIIVKNSWGSDWGMNGYIYMSAEIPNMCGIASCASYPTVVPKGKHGCV